MLRVKRNIVKRLRMDSRIIGHNLCVGRSVAAFAFVFAQVFSDRLPRRGPIIFCVVVPDVNVPSGLVKIVEHIAQDSSVGAGLGKAVAASVV